MKIFSWMQNKINTKQGSRTQKSVAVNQYFGQTSSEKEFNDQHNGLLAIGTLGSSNVTKELDRRNPHRSEASCQDQLEDITPEEVEELQKELNLIISKQEVEGNSLVELDTNQRSYGTSTNSSEKGNQITSSARDSHLESVSNSIGKKSVSFLLKKMFLCSSGFTPTRSLRDPFPEPSHEKSRLQRILRTILSKKIYPKTSSPKATAAKKYLENKQICMTDSEDEMSDEANDGKWVKTDAEFIVLEI